MTKEEYITKAVQRAAENGFYKIDIKLISDCWDEAVKSVKENA